MSDVACALVCGDVRCGSLWACVAATHVATRIDVDAPTREYRIRSFARRARALRSRLSRAFIGEGRTFIHFVI